MAPVPKKLGVEVVLEDIARGIGRAARILPTKSRSEIGAVAVKGARVNLQFDLAIASSSSGVSAGVGATGDDRLGMRSQTFGLGVTQVAVEERRSNRAIIELEIVAIPPALPEPAENGDDGRGGSGNVADEKLEAALRAARAALAAIELTREERREGERLLIAGEKALAAGDRNLAASALQDIARLIEAAKKREG